MEKKDWGVERTRLCAWIAELPKPVAIFAAMDARGRQVIDACLTAGVGIPHEAAILAVDNDALICESTTPPLSSIALDTERMGYEAARLLDESMRQPKTQRITRLFAPLTVVTRRSTEATHINDPQVARALEFIWLNAQNPIGVPEIVQHVGISRRLLEMRFKKILQTTIQNELQRTRLRCVKRLLVETNHSIAIIAESCGFTSISYLSKVFRGAFGVTMTAYRRTQIDG